MGRSTRVALWVCVAGCGLFAAGRATAQEIAAVPDHISDIPAPAYQGSRISQENDETFDGLPGQTSSFSGHVDILPGTGLSFRRIVYFSTVDVARDSRYASAGARFSPVGVVDGSSIVVAMSLGTGWYRYKRRENARNWIDVGVGGLKTGVGYHLRRENYGVTGLIGPALEYQALSRHDRWNRAKGLTIAAQGSVDIWAKPVENMLITGYGALSSFDLRWYARLFGGYELWPEFFAGGEAVSTGNVDYEEWRLGAAVVGIPTGPLKSNLSTGVMLRPGEEPGFYAGGAMWRRF